MHPNKPKPKTQPASRPIFRYATSPERRSSLTALLSRERTTGNPEQATGNLTLTNAEVEELRLVLLDFDTALSERGALMEELATAEVRLAEAGMDNQRQRSQFMREIEKIRQVLDSLTKSLGGTRPTESTR